MLRPLWADLPREVEQPGLFFIDQGKEWNGGPGTSGTDGWVRAIGISSAVVAHRERDRMKRNVEPLNRWNPGTL